MKKRKHHYIWQRYLKPWTENSQIWCFRDEKIFPSNTTGIGQERDFYKLKELTESEIAYIKKNFIRSNSAELNKFNEEGIEFFNQIFRIRSALQKAGINNNDVEIEIDEQIHNLEEDFHAGIENNSIKYLDSLLQKDMSFFNRLDGRLEFLHFMCLQYLRTKNIQEIVCASYEENKEFRIAYAWPMLRHIFAMNVTRSIFADKKYKVVLMINDSSVPFITTDQPIINTFAIRAGNNVETTDLEFYYPISPSIAILITRKEHYQGSTEKHLNAEEVKTINFAMARFSHEQIYANSKAPLEQYVGVFKQHS